MLRDLKVTCGNRHKTVRWGMRRDVLLKLLTIIWKPLLYAAVADPRQVAVRAKSAGRASDSKCRMGVLEQFLGPDLIE